MDVLLPHIRKEALHEELPLTYKRKKYPSIAAGQHRRNSSIPGDFYNPCSIAIDYETNNVYICDVGYNRVQIFTESLQYLNAFTEEMNGPDGICIQVSRVYVTQRGSDSVTMYSTEGRFIKSVGKKGDKELEFDWPRGIAVSSDNIVYICDWANNRIQCLDSKLTFNSIVSGVTGPKDIKLTPKHVIVLTEDNNCIRFYDYHHRLCKEIITRERQSSFSLIPGLNSDYNIVLTDLRASCISVFSSNGDLLNRYERNDDDSDLLQPMSVAVDLQNRIIVTSRNTNYCVMMFNFPEYTSQTSY